RRWPQNTRVYGSAAASTERGRRGACRRHRFDLHPGCPHHIALRADMYTNAADRLESHAFACLAYGVIGDAMGTQTENLEPAEIEERFGWVESFEGDGTDDTIMRDLLAAALIRTRGFADADSWAEQWREQQDAIFGSKVGRFFPSVLHAAAKLRLGYLPRAIAAGTMPSSSSAMAIAPVGIVNAGNPRAAAAQAMEIASLIHVTDVAFCQDGAAAVAAAVAEALIADQRRAISTFGVGLAPAQQRLSPNSSQ